MTERPREADKVSSGSPGSGTPAGGEEGPVFRVEALTRQGGSENLNELLRVTSARSWIVAAALGAVLLVALGWGLFGRISERVTLDCALVLAGERHAIVSPATGSVTEIYVRTEQVVMAGAALARIWVPDLDRHIVLISPFEGTIADHELVLGSVVGVGEAAVWVRGSAEIRFEAVVYAPISQARRLEAGMAATVVRLDDAAAARPLRASVEVVPDRPEADTAWLSHMGLPEPRHQHLVRLSLLGEADRPVFDGELCRAGIVVDRRAPVSLLGAGAVLGGPGR